MKVGYFPSQIGLCKSITARGVINLNISIKEPRSLVYLWTLTHSTNVTYWPIQRTGLYIHCRKSPVNSLLNETVFVTKMGSLDLARETWVCVGDVYQLYTCKGETGSCGGDEGLVGA